MVTITKMQNRIFEDTKTSEASWQFSHHRNFSIQMKVLLMKKQSFRILAVSIFFAAFSALGWVSVNDIQDSSSQITDEKVLEETTLTITAAEQFENYIQKVYATANLQSSGLDYNLFKKAFTGYLNLKSSNLISAKELLTVVDFNKSSTQKRLWIIDLAAQKLLFNTLVAHGQGSGDDMAQKFSNLANSHQSSLGFYVTSDIYYGKHGRSMKLDGMDKGFNSNAKDRAVVVHGAEYVSESFIQQRGRLGRSHGCPALPVELSDKIIDNIKGQTTLFIAGPNTAYASKYTNEESAMAGILHTDADPAVM